MIKHRFPAINLYLFPKRYKKGAVYFLIYELMTPDDIQRDIIDKAGADMKVFEHFNYCLAASKN